MTGFVYQGHTLTHTHTHTHTRTHTHTHTHTFEASSVQKSACGSNRAEALDGAVAFEVQSEAASDELRDLEHIKQHDVYNKLH